MERHPEPLNQEKTMSDSEYVKTVQEAYASFGPRAVPFIIGISRPDVEMDSRYPDEVPFGGIFRGHAGVGQFFAAIGAAVELIRFEPQSFFGKGSQVVVLGREEGIVHATGRRFLNEWVHVWSFSDGKLARIRSYNDTLAARSAFAA
jgi:ketosteroid isomerase-like protein